MKEQEIRLLTKEDDTDTIVTKAKGKLDCIIINANKNVDLIIESSLGYLILKKIQLVGIHYIVPRKKITSSLFDATDMLTFEKFNLNESISITVFGKNADVNVLLRYDD